MSERSALGKLIKSLPRKTYEFDVDGFISMGEERRKVAIRVATKREQDIALAGAHAYVSKMATKTPSFAADSEIVDDAKSAFIVSACCLDPANGMLPVWPTGEVVTEDLTADQIGVLVRLINEVRSKEGPVPTELTDDRVEAFITLASENADNDAPDAFLSALTHPYLVHLYVLTALKLRQARLALKSQEQESSVSNPDRSE